MPSTKSSLKQLLLESIRRLITLITQIAFLGGCNIERVSSSYMRLYTRCTERNGVGLFLRSILKAYDKVRWPFLVQALLMKGFSPIWISLGLSFRVEEQQLMLINNDIGHRSKQQKDLQQEYPLSPILFKFVVNMLVVLTQQSQKKGGRVSGACAIPCGWQINHFTICR